MLHWPCILWYRVLVLYRLKDQDDEISTAVMLSFAYDSNFTFFYYIHILHVIQCFCCIL